MRVTVESAMLRGCEVVPIDVEVAISKGMEGMHIVGMPDVSCLEARERVRAAICESGYTMPRENVLVNLSPSCLRKQGTGFDLAIAAGILAASGQIDPELLAGQMLVGELGIDGIVRPVRGMACYALYCDEYMAGHPFLTCSALASEAGAVARHYPVFGLRTLRDLEKLPDWPAVDPPEDIPEEGGDGPKLDFADIPGQAGAKRACQVAAAGKLGLMMVGPHGAGKTMLAARIPTILPPLAEDERTRVAMVQSSVGEDPHAALAGARPYRTPHHSATAPGMLGGGSPIMAGEVSLAHGGVLFLDEAAEWTSSTLQMLRQPLKEGLVCITRSEGTVEFPADFMLVMASSPCPCGRFGDVKGECTCSAEHVRRYRNRIGGPLADRIDVWADVARVADPLTAEKTQASAELRAGVEAAWEFRAAHGGDIRRMDAYELASQLDDRAQDLLEEHGKQRYLSGNQIVSAMRCARAIADIEQSERIGFDHMTEALGFCRR